MDKSSEGYVPDFTNRYWIKREKEEIGERKEKGSKESNKSTCKNNFY